MVDKNSGENKLLKGEAREIAMAESISSFTKFTYGQLMDCMISYRLDLIPNYFQESAWRYLFHSSEDWIEHQRASKLIPLVELAEKEVLKRYGLPCVSTPFIYKVDEMYLRLRQKPREIVEKFLKYNERKIKENFCSRVFGETKANANYHACLRRLSELPGYSNQYNPLRGNSEVEKR